MIRLNSKEIQPGDTFICLPTAEAYVAEAKANGAAIIHHFTRTELGHFAADHFGHPDQALTLIGVTGTNGKTTVTTLVAQALKSLGYSPLVQGTLSGNLTTPESLDTFQAIKTHLDQGGTHFVMEVSSHAIDQDRIAGLHFAVKCLTNITQDHLDYHKTIEHYRATKLKWMNTPEGIAIFPEEFKQITLPFKNPLLGKFNQENMQAAVAILRYLGFSDTDITKGLSDAKAPPGRFETIDAPHHCLVIVDYAHTPDGLEKILEEGLHLANTRKGKLWALFGCGGDRDRGKRPQMAAIAAKLADHVILTHDNPRTEDPAQILRDIQSGLPKNHPVIILEDREKAIQYAIEYAKENDVIVLAGKGHETYQIIGTEKRPFDDKVIAKTALKRKYP